MDFMPTPTHDLAVQFRKLDDEQQVVFGEVFAPNVPDSQGDFMSAAEIRAMAHDFLRRSRTSNVDKDHDNRTFGAAVVESWIARDDDPVFIPGSWVVGVNIPDPVTWAAVKSGQYNGFSLDGAGDRTPKALKLDVPEVLKGDTTSSQDHSHEFVVQYDQEGRFLGGRTNTVKGHSHVIQRGTVTEDAHGHSHRFSFVEQIHGHH